MSEPLVSRKAAAKLAEEGQQISASMKNGRSGSNEEVLVEVTAGLRGRKGSKRTSFAFSDEAVEQLKAIKARSRLETDADVIRAALDCYDELVDVALSGSKIIVRDKGGQEWLYSPFAPFRYPGIGPRRAKTPIEQQRHRKTFVFPVAAMAKLETIRRRSRYTANADVIRAALDCYGELVEVVLAGDAIYLRNEAGEERNYTPYAPLLREGFVVDTSRPIATKVRNSQVQPNI